LPFRRDDKPEVTSLPFVQNKAHSPTCLWYKCYLLVLIRHIGMCQVRVRYSAYIQVLLDYNCLGMWHVGTCLEYSDRTYWFHVPGRATSRRTFCLPYQSEGNKKNYKQRLTPASLNLCTPVLVLEYIAFKKVNTITCKLCLTRTLQNLFNRYQSYRSHQSCQ
jgi:hypothetical protein